MDEPVTTPDQSPSVATHTQTQPPTPPAADGPWNGEIESLEKQPW